MNDFIRLEQRGIDGHYVPTGFPIPRRGQSMPSVLVMILGIGLLIASALVMAALVLLPVLARIGGAL